jgi:hypothetical protein
VDRRGREEEDGYGRRGRRWTQKRWPVKNRVYEFICKKRIPSQLWPFLDTYFDKLRHIKIILLKYANDKPLYVVQNRYLSVPIATNYSKICMIY